MSRIRNTIYVGIPLLVMAAIVLIVFFPFQSDTSGSQELQVATVDVGKVIRSFEEAVDRHELVKVKFNDFKEKEQKAEISEQLARKTGAQMAGRIGHTAIFYREQKDPEKRKILLPKP